MTWVQRLSTGRTSIENLDGVPWYEAPIPRRWHRCKAQTRGTLNYFEHIERCACGSVRPDWSKTWIERNSRRKS